MLDSVTSALYASFHVIFITILIKILAFKSTHYYFHLRKEKKKGETNLLKVMQVLSSKAGLDQFQERGGILKIHVVLRAGLDQKLIAIH